MREQELAGVPTAASADSKALFYVQTYKLNLYEESIAIYCKLIEDGQLAEEEVSDVASNLLACGSNAIESMPKIDNALRVVGSHLEKTYEYVFNEGLVQISKSLYKQALNSLLTSYQLALKEEDGGPLSQADLVRFKVQEIHTLNSFYQQFSRIEYD